MTITPETVIHAVRRQLESPPMRPLSADRWMITSA
jgi:hypothetical protein